MAKIRKVGIIAEDDGDFLAAKIFISRISGRHNLSFEKVIGHGCGKIKSKCYAWSQELSRRGCDALILIHDLDRNILEQLESDISKKLQDSNITNRLICIPIEEIEAWFLSDPSGIRDTFKLVRKPKIKGLPETIPSPKERLGRYIRECSNNKFIYINSRHNQLLAQNISINDIKTKCPSFDKFHNFVLKQNF